jgi:ariadne-1
MSISAHDHVSVVQLCGAAVGAAHTWEKIDGHTCGRYKQEQERRASAAHDSLKRYLFYWERFSAHEAARSLQDRTIAAVRQKVISLIRADESEFYTRWMAHAVEKLADARRMLSYSYAFCYYAFAEPDLVASLSAKQLKINQTLFEDYQQQLELNVERLARLLETPCEVFGANDCKTVIAMTVNVDRRCKGMCTFGIALLLVLSYSSW